MESPRFFFPSATELSVESGTELFSLMEDKGALGQPKTPYIAAENDGRTISVQVLEFKTSLLEAVEELHIHRDAETRHEEQICKLVLEKQELEWEKESLQSQISRMSNENSESLAAVKKQFQAQIRRLEGEKGKNQLAAELKDKEITSLKEELKQLQLLRYSLEKKLSELEQKLQLQTQTKDSHLNQLGEVERRFAAISRQCAMVKQAHEKLEQNVEEAMRINKKLTSINEKQESTIKGLKEDLERLNKELVKFKVSSVCRPGEERLQNVLKEQEFQQLQQKLFVETEFNKKLRNETTTERAEKQEVLRSLHHNQRLLQTQTEALSRAEQELRTLREEYQILKTEHELNQERTKEKEDRFARLRDEYQNSKLTWEKEILQLQMSAVADQEELIVVKHAYSQLQEERKQLSISAVHKVKDCHNSEIAPKDQENSLGTTSNEINLVKVSSLHKDLEDSLISPHDNREPTSHPDKDIPDESTESQKARKDGHSQNDNKELDIFLQVDRIVPVLSPMVSTDGSDNISKSENVNPKTNHMSKLCDETKTGVSESEPVTNAVDKGCPANPAQSDTDSRLAELSQPETRSVYGVDGDPLALELKDRQLEQNLCISEVTESQTSDKQMDSQGYATSQSKEFKDHQTAIPECLHSVSQKESPTTTERLSEDKTANSNTQDTVVFHDKTDITEGLIAAQPSPCYKTVYEEPETTFDSASATTCLDTHFESKDHFSPPELICEPSQSRVSQADHSTETTLYNGVSEVESKQLPLVDQTTSVTTVDMVEVISENNDQKDDGTFLSQPLKAQQIELDVSSEEAKITNLDQDLSSPGSTTANDQSDVDQNSSSMVDTSDHSENGGYQSSFAWDTFMKGKKKLWSSGFHELVSPFCAPIFMKDKLAKRAMMKTSDRLETTSIHPHQKNGCQGEWNAIKQSFMLTEKENQVLISYSSSGSPASSSVGNGLRQESTPTIPPLKLQSLEKQTWPMTSSSERKEEWKQCDIMAQIAKIEEFMSSEDLTPQKKRKID